MSPYESTLIHMAKKQNGSIKKTCATLLVYLFRLNKHQKSSRSNKELIPGSGKVW